MKVFELSEFFFWKWTITRENNITNGENDKENKINQKLFSKVSSKKIITFLIIFDSVIVAQAAITKNLYKI